MFPSRLHPEALAFLQDARDFLSGRGALEKPSARSAQRARPSRRGSWQRQPARYRTCRFGLYRPSQFHHNVRVERLAFHQDSNQALGSLLRRFGSNCSDEFGREFLKLDWNQMKIIRLERYATLTLISKAKTKLRFFAGFSSSLRAFARPAGDSRKGARKSEKPAKVVCALLSLHRIFLACLIVSALIL